MFHHANIQRVAFSQLPSLKNTPALQRCLSTGGFNTDRGTTPPKVLIIQNDLLVNPCIAIASLIDHDIVYDVIYAYHQHAFKNLHPLMYSGILVLGGRVAAYSAPKRPWLQHEIDFMIKALESNVPILGTCLGSQLLAKCIGGTVIPGQSGVEIGYKKWDFPQIDPFVPNHPMLPHPEPSKPPPLKDLKLGTLGRSMSTTSLGIRRSTKEHGHDLSSTFEMKMADEMKEIIEFDEDDDAEVFEEESDDDAEETALFRINKRPCYDSTDDEDQTDDVKESQPVDPPPTTYSAEEIRRFLLVMDKDPNLGVKDIQQKLLQFVDGIIGGASLLPEEEEEAVTTDESMDPFERVIYSQDMDRFIVLFHGDTFDLPEKCRVSKQEVRLLATTDRYRVLFKVGDWNYGFQGHPELTYDMLSVWCKCLDQFDIDENVLRAWGGDLERDVIGYAKKHEQRILDVSKTIFDVWCKEVVLKKLEEREHFHLVQHSNSNSG